MHKTNKRQKRNRLVQLAAVGWLAFSAIMPTERLAWLPSGSSIATAATQGTGATHPASPPAAAAPRAWIAADPASAGSIRFSGSGNPEVLPQDSMEATGKASSLQTSRDWIAADPRTLEVQIDRVGAPVVPASAAASPAAKIFSPAEAMTVGNRVVPAPSNAVSSGTPRANGSANPSTVAFGGTPINTTVTQNVTITADAGYRVEIASGSGINAPFAFNFDTCGVAGGFTGPGTCNVIESYTPTALTASSGTTNVFECPIAGGSCVAIPFNVSGTGISVAAANPATVNFASVPLFTTANANVTITVDAGYRTQIASGSGINVPFAFSFDTCGAGGGFAGPGTCNVIESYTATALTTSSGTTNVFECPIAGGSCIAIPYGVSGTGISLAGASPATVGFANVPINTTVSQSVTVTADTGYRVVLASGSGINAPFAFNFDTCGAGGGFAGPGTCNVIESYTPTALAVSSATTNVFECPIAGGSCLAIPFNVSGTGVSVAAASPPAINFGNVPINTTAPHNVTITADTGYRIEVASGSGLNPPFGFNFDACGAGSGFAGPGTCNVIESYTPTTLVFSSASTSVFECPIAGGSCIGIPFTEQGTGVPDAPVFQSAVSRRVHGSAGTFDLPLSLAATNPTTEPRIGPSQTVVLTFDKPPIGASATVTEGAATAGAPSFSGNSVIVPLSGVGNAQYVTVSLSNVASSDGGTGGSASIRIGLLAGDVNQNRVVTVADLGLVNAQLAQFVTAANYLKDVNASGTMSVADKALTNAHLTTALPAP